MKLHAYCVYDRKALVYNAPFFAVSDGSAARSFSDLANDKSTTVGRHPNDYVLFRVGSFDDASGQLLSDTAVHIADANAFVQHQSSIFRSDDKANGPLDVV